MSRWHGLLAAVLCLHGALAGAQPVAPRVVLKGPWDAARSRAVCEVVLETLGLAHDVEPPQSCETSTLAEASAQPLLVFESAEDGALKVSWLPTQPSRPQLWTAVVIPAQRVPLTRLREAVRRLVLDAPPWPTPTVPPPALVEGRRMGRPAAVEEPSFPVQARLTSSRLPSNGPRYVRTALDLSTYLVFGAVWYAADTTIHQVDWRYDLSLDTLHRKLVTFDAVGFDDNSLALNSPGHPMAGTLYYLSGRVNRLPAHEAFLGAIAASSAWELVVEYREELSLNDMVFTPGGAIAQGEPLYLIGEFFRRSDATAPNRLFGALLQGPAPLFPWTDALPPLSGRDLDQRGYTRSMWRDIRASGGLRVATTSSKDPAAAGVVAHVRARVVDVQGFGRHQNLPTQWLNRPLAGALEVALATDERGLPTYAIEAEAVWRGAYGQRLRADASSSWTHSWLGGFSALYEHRHGEAGDTLAAVGPVGAVARGMVEIGELRLSTAASVHPALAMVRSHAPADALNGSGSAFEVLREQGYYHSIGARASLEAGARWRGARAEVDATWHGLTSAHLLDTGADAGLSVWDERVRLELELGFKIRDQLEILLRGTRALRVSEVAGERADGAEDAFVAALAWEL